MHLENKKSTNVPEEKELKVYCCPNCKRILFKGFVLSFALVCPFCNQFVRIKEQIHQS